METLHTPPSSSSHAALITFAIAVVGAIVMSLPPSEPPPASAPHAQASGAQVVARTRTARRASRPCKPAQGAAAVRAAAADALETDGDEV